MTERRWWRRTFGAADAADLGFAGRSFTIETWLWLHSVGDNVILGTRHHVAGARLHCLIRGGAAHFGFYSADVTGRTRIPLRSWHHLAFVYDAAARTQTIWLDGVVDGQRRDAEPLRSGGDVTLGNYNGSGLCGALAGLRLWSEARSPEQLRSCARNFDATNELTSLSLAPPRTSTTSAITPRGAALGAAFQAAATTRVRSAHMGGRGVAVERPILLREIIGHAASRSKTARPLALLVPRRRGAHLSRRRCAQRGRVPRCARRSSRVLPSVPSSLISSERARSRLSPSMPGRSSIPSASAAACSTARRFRRSLTRGASLPQLPRLFSSQN